MRFGQLFWWLLLTGCPPALRMPGRVQPDPVRHYRTFAIAPGTGPLDGYRRVTPPADARGYEETVAGVLEGRAYHREAANAAELIIDVAVGETRAGRELSADVDGTGSQIGIDDPDGAFNYTERAIIVDAIDAKTGDRVWHGTAPAPSGGTLDAARRESAVRAILQDFPAPSAAAQ
jgi:hypothetical protein